MAQATGIRASVEANRRVAVLVQSTLPGSLWWVQAPPAQSSNGEITAKVLFGNQSTQGGSKFRVTLLILGEAEEASRYKTGDSFDALPEGVPHTERIEVVLKK